MIYDDELDFVIREEVCRDSKKILLDSKKTLVIGFIIGFSIFHFVIANVCFGCPHNEGHKKAVANRDADRGRHVKLEKIYQYQVEHLSSENEHVFLDSKPRRMVDNSKQQQSGENAQRTSVSTNKSSEDNKLPFNLKESDINRLELTNNLENNTVKINLKGNGTAQESFLDLKFQGTAQELFVDFLLWSVIITGTFVIMAKV